MVEFMMWIREEKLEPSFILMSAENLSVASGVAKMFCERNNLELMGVTFLYK